MTLVCLHCNGTASVFDWCVTTLCGVIRGVLRDGVAREHLVAVSNRLKDDPALRKEVPGVNLLKRHND